MKEVYYTCDECGKAIILDWDYRYTPPPDWFRVLDPPHPDEPKSQYWYYDACCENCRDRLVKKFEKEEYKP